MVDGSALTLAHRIGVGGGDHRAAGDPGVGKRGGAMRRGVLQKRALHLQARVGAANHLMAFGGGDQFSRYANVAMTMTDEFGDDDLGEGFGAAP